MWKVVASSTTSTAEERVNKSPPSRILGAAAQPSYSSSRWCPTAEQLGALEELYKRGIRTPSTFQIQQITAQLRRMGKIEGKNVFYWFQNHKARERQKLRRRLLRFAASSSKGLAIARTPDVQALHYNINWPTATATALSHTTTPPIQEAVLIKQASDKTEGERDGWIKQQHQQQQLLLLQQSDNGISPSRHSHVAIQLTHTNPIQCSHEELSVSQLHLPKIDVTPSSDFQARPCPTTLQLFPLHGNNSDGQAHQDPVLFYEFL